MNDITYANRGSTGAIAEAIDPFQSIGARRVRLAKTDPQCLGSRVTPAHEIPRPDRLQHSRSARQALMLGHLGNRDKS